MLDFTPHTIHQSFLQKSFEPEEIIEKIQQTDENETDFSRIRCPLCAWQPNKSEHWMCADCGHPEYFFGACYTSWNTFETRGICPGCAHQWRYTSCLRCAGWSPHEDWYATENQ